MELRLKTLLEQAQFTKYKGKGYDAAEVDDFLDRATAMAAKVETQLTESMARPGSGGGASSGPTNAEVEAEVSRRVEARLADLRDSGKTGGPAAPPDTAAAERAAEEAAEQSHRTLLLAQRTADSAVREAREEAETLLADARERSTSTVAEAEAHGIRLRAEGETEARRELQEARRRLGEEISQLEALRDASKTDIAVMERHLEEERGRLGSSIAELQRLLDDPVSFRLAPTPDLIDPEVPDLSVDGPDDGPAGDDESGSDGDTAIDAAPRSAGGDGSTGGDDRTSGAGKPSSAPAEGLADTSGLAGEVGGSVTRRSSGSGDTADRVIRPSGGQAPSGSLQPGSGGQRADLGSASAERSWSEGSLLTATASGGVAMSDVDHQTPELADLADSGSSTSPTPVVDLDLTAAEADLAPSDDAFLAELRKAMADEEPLGPRPIDPADKAAVFGEGRPGRRFGRRR